MYNYHVFYTNFLKDRVQVVTKADTIEQALMNAAKGERAFNAAQAMPITEDEFQKFAKKWKAVA